MILKLLVAWKDPLWQFHQNMVHQDDFNNFSSNKALEMSYMVHELRKGVEKVADKVRERWGEKMADRVRGRRGEKIHLRLRTIILY